MRFAALLVSSALAITFTPLTLYAQSADQADADQDDGRIVVTAQRREQALQSTPVAVTALTSDTLDTMGIENVQDLGRTVPNLQLLPVTANPSTFQVGLRGGSEQVSGIIVSEPVVGIYVDDVYRARLQGANSQLGDIERVEILRGPQGTLYGRNNFSGAVKMITRTPGVGDEWVNASIGYGTFDEINAQASIGQALSDNVGVSVSALYRDQSDGWIYNRAQDRTIGAEENVLLRGKLAFDNGPLRISASASWGKDVNDGYIPVAISLPRVPTGRSNFVRTSDATPRVGNDPYITDYPQESLGRTETFALTLDVAYDVGNITLRSISGYVDLKDDFRWDLAAGTEVSPGVFSAAFDRNSVAQADQFTQELQVQGTALDERLDWIAGVFYFEEDGTQSLTDNIPLFFLFNLEPTFLDIQTESWAVFSQASYAFSDIFSATIGARYTEDNKSFEADIQSGFGFPTPRTAVSLDEKFTSFTPKFGLDMQLSDDLFAYASISRGFKGGGFNGLSVLNPTVLAASYGPQSVWAYEGGLKAEFLDRRLTTNLAVFYNDISDLQQTAQIGPASFAQQNVGDAKLLGFELEVSARPTDGLRLFGNLGYQDGDYVTLDPASQAFTAGATDLPLVSKWSWQAGFTYEFDLGDAALLRFGADARYAGDNFVEVTNALLVEGYTRVNGFASLSTQDERWSLKLQGQNLTDETNFVSGFVSSTNPALTVLKPRTMLITLSYKMD